MYILHVTQISFNIVCWESVFHSSHPSLLNSSCFHLNVSVVKSKLMADGERITLKHGMEQSVVSPRFLYAKKCFQASLLDKPFHWQPHTQHHTLWSDRCLGTVPMIRMQTLHCRVVFLRRKTNEPADKHGSCVAFVLLLLSYYYVLYKKTYPVSGHTNTLTHPPDASVLYMYFFDSFENLTFFMHQRCCYSFNIYQMLHAGPVSSCPKLSYLLPFWVLQLHLQFFLEEAQFFFLKQWKTWESF